jgi:hypothetical protein
VSVPYSTGRAQGRVVSRTQGKNAGGTSERKGGNKGERIHRRIRTIAQIRKKKKVHTVQSMKVMEFPRLHIY